jgi:FdhD protein
MCLPEFFEELAVGFLFSEGIIQRYSDIEQIDSTCTGNVFVTCKNAADKGRSAKQSRVVVSGCAGGSVNLDFLNLEGLRVQKAALQLEPQEILEIMADFGQASELFRTTGGVHSSALVLPGGLRLFYEDIGRHNAIDKIVGTALKQDIPIQDGLLLTSGRVSSEIMIKTAKLGIPVLISHSAPTDMAVEIAHQVDMTLIAFVRGARFNVYSGEHRLDTCGA